MTKQMNANRNIWLTQKMMGTLYDDERVVNKLKKINQLG